MDYQWKETAMATDITTEAATESADELAKRFERLAATWREDTNFSSRSGRDAQHPAYQEIIAMGEKAVPLLLADLEKDPDHWFIALYRITGANRCEPGSQRTRGQIERNGRGLDRLGPRSWL
jgi:hypothetical protein